MRLIRRTARSCALALLLTLAGVSFASAADSSALGDWPLPARGYDNNRYVTTNLITRTNVARLRRAWVFPIDDAAMVEVAPIVVNGTMYVTSGLDTVYALDAATGALKWRTPYHLSRNVGGIDANRGVAYGDGKLFLGTLDGHLVALDAATGSVVWDVVGVQQPENSFYTMAPTPFRGTVLMGVSNGDWGGIGYVTAFDAASGKRLWDWQTVAPPGTLENATWSGDSWKHGGGAVWGGLTLDAGTATLYFDVGNPQPDLIGAMREGSNLYTASMIALDISGAEPKMKWYRQFIPHDTHDWDAAMPPVRFRGVVNGASRQLVATADKGGNFWLLDPATGRVLEHNVVSTQTPPADVPTYHGTVACPGTNGGVQYNGGAYLPQTNMFYVPSIEQCQVYFSNDSIDYKPGEMYFGGYSQTIGNSTGWMNAIDIGTGQMIWRRKVPVPAMGGALALSSGVIFSGHLDGTFMAYDAKTGARLWSVQTGSPIKAPPTAYLSHGKAYIAVGSGDPGGNFYTPGVPRQNAGPLISAYTLP